MKSLVVYMEEVVRMVLQFLVQVSLEEHKVAVQLMIR